MTIMMMWDISVHGLKKRIRKISILNKANYQLINKRDSLSINLLWIPVNIKVYQNSINSTNSEL